MEPSSIIVAKYLTGLKELVIMVYTDCGISLDYKNADVLLENIFNQLEHGRLRKFRSFIGEPFKSRLLDWLKAFEDAQEVIKKTSSRFKRLIYDSWSHSNSWIIIRYF